MVVISCAFPGCEFKSEDFTEPIAYALLQSHSFSYAAAPTAHPAVGPVLARERQGPKLERPTLILASRWKSETYSLVGGVC